MLLKKISGLFMAMSPFSFLTFFSSALPEIYNNFFLLEMPEINFNYKTVIHIIVMVK